MDDKRLLLWVFLFAPLSKERSSPKRAELHPLPRFNRLYSTTSFRFSCSTSAVANGGGGDAVSPQQKNRTAQKKARQTANALTMGALKSLFASLLLKAICVGVHTLVCDAWHGLSVTKAIQTATGCQIIRLLRRANKCHGSPSELTHGG